MTIRADGSHIEEAVRARILEQGGKDAKARNFGLEQRLIEDAVDKALSMTRRGNAGRHPDGN